MRRTDTVCLLPDGSWALLLLHAGDRQLKIVARRLMTVAEDPSVVAALLAVDGRRDEADLLWLSLSRAYEDCKAGAERVIVVS